MEFEIVEAYLIKHKKIEKPQGWSLHIYFPEIDLDLRGYRLIKTGQGWWLNAPSLSNYDEEEDKVIRFPIFSFCEREKGRFLLEKIKEKAIAYVEEKIKLDPNPKQDKQ